MNGWLTAYLKIPAFIVTLGGLLAYSGLAFYLAKGETVAPMDKTYEIFGGGIPISWLGPVLELGYWRSLSVQPSFSPSSMAAASASASSSRLRPVWAEVFLAVLGSAVVLGVTNVMNSYPWPFKLIENYAKANGVSHSAGRRKQGWQLPSAWQVNRSCAAPKA